MHPVCVSLLRRCGRPHNDLVAVSVLGELRIDGEPLSPRERAVLAILVMRMGRPVSPEEIADAYWGERPPATWPKQVQAAIARLRRRLGAGSIRTGPGGYTFAADPESVDVGRFERLAAAGRSHLDSGQPDRGVVVLEAALELWRGRPYADLAAWPDALAEAGRLDELRALVTEDLVHARLESGRPDEVVAAAHKLVREHPLRERPWLLLATALYRAGRSADALGALRSARRRFDEDLGVEPGQEIQDLEVAILRQDPGLAPPAPAPLPAEDCPYVGLAAYDTHDADQFFGREADVAAALERLSRGSFLALAGSSGCGKSSLVKAGVVPALRRQGKTVTVVTPGWGAGAALRSATEPPYADVLVVDQFEEVFHAGLREDEVADLCARVAAYPASVVLTVRSDFLDECAAQPSLARLLAEGVSIVSPMTPDQLQAAIVEPARRASLRLEHGLVELVLRDAAGSTGALPLVSHAMVETWLRREGPVLTIDGYEASGGISGAVAQSADRMYEALDSHQREVCRSTLLRLVAMSPEGSPVRQQLRLKPLRADSERAQILTMLASARLVSTEGESVVVAHEAVALAWPRLRGWLEDSAEEARLMSSLSVAAERWEGDGEPTEDLYRGARLEAALELRESGTVDLTPVEDRFLDESSRHHEAGLAELAARARHETQQNRRLRAYLVTTASLLILALVASALLVVATRETDRQQALADSAREDAVVEAVVARSLALRDTERDVAALLAAEAYRRWPGDPRSRSALMGTLTAADGFLGVLYADLDTPLPGARIPGSGDHLLLRPDGAAVTLDERGGVRVADSLGWSGVEADRRTGLVAVSQDGRTGVVARAIQDDAEESTELVVLDLPELRPRGPSVRVAIDPGTISVSPDGSRAVLGSSEDGHVAVVHLDTGAVRDRRLVLDGAGSDFAARTLVAWTSGGSNRGSDGGSIVVAGAYGRLRVLDSSSLRTRVATTVPAGSANVALAATGSMLVASGSRHLVAVDLRDGRISWTRAFAVQHPAPCPWLTGSVKAGAVFCGDWFGNLEQRSLDDGLPIASLDPQLGSVGPLSVSRDGKELTALADGVPAVLRWQLDGGGLVRRLVARGSVVYEGYDAAGRGIVTARRPGGAREYHELTDFAVWDPARDVATFSVPGRAEGLGWAGDGVLVGWSHQAGGVAFLDVRQGSWYRNEPDLDHHVRLWPGPDGDTTYSAAPGGRVVVIDPRSGRPTGREVHVGGEVLSLSVSADGRRMATASWNDGWRVQVHDLVSGDRIGQPLAGPQLVAFAPDGELYAAQDGRLTRHDPADLSLLGTLPGAHGEVNSMQFSRDGRMLLVTANDETAALYDVATGLRLGDPLETAAPLIVPAFLRPDGAELAVTDERGVAIWSLDPAAHLEAACRIAGRELTAEEWSTYFGPDVDQRATCGTVLQSD